MFDTSVGRNCSDITVNLQVQWNYSLDNTRMPSLNVCVQITMFGILTSKSFADDAVDQDAFISIFLLLFIFIFYFIYLFIYLKLFSHSRYKHLSLLASLQVTGTAQFYDSVCYLAHRDLFCVPPTRFYSAVRLVTCLVTINSISGMTRYMIRENTITVISNYWGNAPDYECLPKKNQWSEQYDHMHLAPFTLLIYFRSSEIRYTRERCSRKPARDVCPRLSYCKDFTLDWSRMCGFLQTVFRFRYPMRW
jgi:hypothetical protein